MRASLLLTLALSFATTATALSPLSPLSPRNILKRGCSSGYKTCGDGCVLTSDTCCPDGSGGCPSSQYCSIDPEGIYGCCDNGENCVGPGGVHTEYDWDVSTSTRYTSPDYTTESPTPTQTDESSGGNDDGNDEEDQFTVSSAPTSPSAPESTSSTGDFTTVPPSTGDGAAARDGVAGSLQVVGAAVAVLLAL